MFHVYFWPSDGEGHVDGNSTPRNCRRAGAWRCIELALVCGNVVWRSMIVSLGEIDDLMLRVVQLHSIVLIWLLW